MQPLKKLMTVSILSFVTMTNQSSPWGRKSLLGFLILASTAAHADFRIDCYFGTPSQQVSAVDRDDSNATAGYVSNNEDKLGRTTQAASNGIYSYSFSNIYKMRSPQINCSKDCSAWSEIEMARSSLDKVVTRIYFNSVDPSRSQVIVQKYRSDPVRLFSRTRFYKWDEVNYEAQCSFKAL